MKRFLLSIFLISLCNVVIAQSGCVSISQDTIVLCSDGAPIVLPPASPLGGNYTTAGVYNLIGDDFYFDTRGVTPGFYPLIYTYSGGSCTGSDTIVAQVVSTGVVSVFGADTTICYGDTAVIQTTKDELVLWSGAITGPQTFDSIGLYSPSSSQEFYYEYSYIVDANMNCMVRKYFDINVINYTSGPSIIGTDFTCSGVHETFSILPTGLVNGQEYSWIWANGSVGNNLDTAFDESGSVDLFITSENGCDTVLSFDIVVSYTPELVVDSYYEICNGDPLYLYPQGGDVYRIGTDLFPSTSDVIVYPQSDTSYFITAFSNDLLEECSDTATISVRLFPYPNITVTGMDTLCRGESISLAVNGAESYDWFAMESNGSLIYPPLGASDSVAFLPDSTVNVLVRGYQYICYDEEIVEVFVNQLPNVEILQTGSSCLDSNVVYTASGADIYEWSNGSDALEFDEIVLNDTIYYLTGEDIQTHCINYDTLFVYANSNPIIELFAPDSVCSIDPFLLQAQGGVSYQWSHTTETDSAVAFASLNADGFIEVIGFTEFGCGGRDTVVVKVVNKPFLTTSPDVESCLGATINMQVFSNATYTPALENNQTTFVATTDTILTFTSTNDFGCTTVADFNVSISDSPNIIVIGESNACPGDQLFFQAQGAVNYFWNIEANGNEASVVVESDSVIVVAGFGENGCLGTTSFEINMRDIPSSDIIGADLLCYGGSTVLQGAGDFELIWEGSVIDSQLVLNNITSDTLIQVQVINEFGCAGSIEKWVRIADLNPDVTIFGDDSLCAGESTILYGQGVDAYFYWYDSIPGFSYAFENLFADTSVSITVYNELGCDTTFSKLIRVFDYPQIAFADGLFACSGEWVTVDANTDVPVLWDDGIYSPYRQFILTEDTVLYATAIGENFCLSHDTAVVGISQSPIVSVISSGDVCEGDLITLTASGANTYEWSNGEEGSVLVVEAELNQSFSVTGFNEDGCYQVATVTPAVNEVSSIQVQFMNDTVCEYNQGIELIVNPSGGILSGDGIIDGIFSPSGPGVYEVQYSVILDNGCTATGSDAIQIGGCVGIDEELLVFSDLYPNPGNGFIQWDVRIRQVEIIDAMGRILSVKNVLSGNIDLTDLPEGTYVLVGYANDGMVARGKYVLCCR